VDVPQTHEDDGDASVDVGFGKNDADVVGGGGRVGGDGARDTDDGDADGDRVCWSGNDCGGGGCGRDGAGAGVGAGGELIRGSEPKTFGKILYRGRSR
jgi:hypothetical protein